MTVVHYQPDSLSGDLIVTAIDLTRACAANELYLNWLVLYSTALDGSAGIAHYLATAATAFEKQRHLPLATAFDPFIARENLSDILMTSPPLGPEELQAAVTTSIEEAREDEHPSLCFTSLLSTDRQRGV